MTRIVDQWGRVILDPKAVFDLAYAGIDVWAVPVEIDETITRYNELCEQFNRDEHRIEGATDMPHSPEEEHADRSSRWLIADDIRAIPVREFLLGLCKRPDEIDRVNLEMDLFEERNLIPLLQLMMYLVAHMRANRIVWGVGRGSSVASYCLFLIGVHKIDAIKYNLSVHDFLK